MKLFIPIQIKQHSLQYFIIGAVSQDTGDVAGSRPLPPGGQSRVTGPSDQGPQGHLCLHQAHVERWHKGEYKQVLVMMIDMMGMMTMVMGMKMMMMMMMMIMIVVMMVMMMMTTMMMNEEKFRR